MKKGILTILSLVLMASSAFGSDVLFKMVMTNRNAVSSTADAQTRDLSASNDAYFLNGGNVTMYSTTNNTPVIASGGLLRITKPIDYATVTLPTGITLQAGDVISYVGENDFPIFIDEVAAARNGKSMKPSEPYTVQAGDFLVGANSFYLGYGKSVTSPHNQIKSITITRPSESVKFYDFEPLADSTYAKGDGDYTTHTIETADGQVRLNSNGDNKIEVYTGFGGANMLKLAGDGLKRSLLIDLAEPCAKIEVWATRESDDERKLCVSDDRTALTPTGGDLISSGTGIQKGEKSYTAGSRPYDKPLYISSSKGGWHVLAVRVTYAVRDEAGLVIKNGDNEISTVKQPISNSHTSYTIQTSSSATIGKNVSDIQTTNVEIIDNTLKVRGRQEGVSVITISQVANEYHYAAEASLTVTVEPEATTLATFDVNSEGLTTSNSTNPLTVGNYMFATVSGNDAGFAKAAAIYVMKEENEILTKIQALRVQTGTYRIHVPSNMRIYKVKILGQSYGNSVSRLSIDGSDAEDFPAKTEDSASKTHEFTISSPANGKAIDIVATSSSCIIMELYGVESTLYPVTINHGWASFCAPEDVEIPEGVTAYYAKEERDMNDDVTLYVVALEGNKIPANEGVILSAETDGTYQLRATTDAPALVENHFGYTTKRTANPNVANTYTLWYDSEEDAVVFAKYTGAYIPANKAYYTYNAPGGGASAPKRIRLATESENTATGIESQELKANSQKLIENGQLVIIKNGIRYNAQGQIVK